MKEWGETRSQQSKKAHKVQVCLRKKAYPTKHAAEVAARAEMRQSLRTGFVLRLRVYECPVSDPLHYHLTGGRSKMALGYQGTFTAAQWAKELDFSWNDDDEKTCQAVLRQWEREAAAEMRKYSEYKRYTRRTR